MSPRSDQPASRPTPPGAPAALGPIRVVIADDHAVVRDGLRALVETQPDLTVVGEAADGEAACHHARALAPDVLLLDLSMPGVSGAEAAEHIARDCPRVRVLVLTMHKEQSYVTRLLGAGAAGYVLKRTASVELVRAIRVVAAGGTYVDPALGEPPRDAVPRPPVPPARLNGAPQGPPPEHLNGASRASSDGAPTGALTALEGAVLRLVACGCSNTEVGAALDLPVTTVATKKADGLAKLGLWGRATLVRYALDRGWLADG